jgi:hypothetical protein
MCGDPPLAKGDKGGFYSIGKDMEIFMIDKISPYPSLPKRGIREWSLPKRGIREDLIARCSHRRNAYKIYSKVMTKELCIISFT